MVRDVPIIAVEMHDRSLGFLVCFKEKGRQFFPIQAGITNQLRMKPDPVRVDVKNAVRIVKKALRAARG